ncbi:hypothetical protein BGX30_006399, partial [Mortierella sp. GBA39]
LFGGEKTEKATPKKRQDTRKKGQVAKSQDLTGAVVLLASFFSLLMFGSSFKERLVGLFKDIFLNRLTMDLSINNVMSLAVEYGIDILLLLAPVFLTVVVMALAANLMQVGFMLTGESLKPKFSKLDPIKGFKNIFSVRSLVEFAKSILKLVIIGFLVYQTLRGAIADIGKLSEVNIEKTFHFVASLTMTLGLKIGAALFVMAALDFLYQKYEFEKSIRMSKQDIKDEYKKMEGDPLIKGKIRERQRRMAMQRMMQEVPKADVVITNQTHFAIAKENGVITMENKPLARALFQRSEIGDSIPADLFQAVAEVLAYEALQFSIFPSLLLITTLFRLALNISTTKLILSEGFAGDVVKTFGSWIARGEIAVGFIVFLILVVVQFIVITKGSERVAEVAARFTLDAMPGKQMSIDADLNAGMINEQQARERRRKVEREADFYGAMDGASKFVKGDAIASIIILLINLVGGFIIGIAMRGLSFQDAMSTYSVLTIGDGLVSQIPALLISTASGLIVTRSSSEGNLANDLTKQLLSYPKLLYIVAATIALLGLFTPIHLITTLPLAGLLAFAAYRMQRNMDKKQIEVEQLEEEQQIEEVRSPESVINLLQVDPIEFEFGYGLIPLADTQQGGDLLDRIIMIRRQCALELGLVVPVIRIRDNIQLKPNEYVIKIKGNTVGSGELLLNHYLAMSPGYDDESITGIETLEPAFGLPALWIDEATKDRAELSGYTVVDPPSVVATHLTELIKKHAHELLGRQETKTLVDNLRENYPVLVDELIPSVLSIGD